MLRASRREDWKRVPRTRRSRDGRSCVRVRRFCGGRVGV